MLTKILRTLDGISSQNAFTFSGPPGCPTLSRWAGWSDVQVGRTSDVEIGQMTYPVNSGTVGSEEGTKDKVTNRKRAKEGVEWEEPLAMEGGLYLNICAGAPEFLVTPLPN